MKVDDLGFQVHQAVFEAVKRGNVEFVTEMIKSIPELAWSRDINGRNIFFIAILNRQEKIFNLLHGLTDAQKMKVISPLDRFGIACYIGCDVSSIGTACRLGKEGEKWMKEISTASSFVAALIVTIMFAAAFTIPGVLMFLGILISQYAEKQIPYTVAQKADIWPILLSSLLRP
ncbi:hypothetical protein CK203_044189 [Vitis vinifera]|uniref:PGG domain-containing protein n=1 Tax=Vitis vinifera TaxID=29760 RepID=A0A438I2K4_VITVI|nr:hypothetical protein CK203_044189 [Vitis vinifera]